MLSLLSPSMTMIHFTAHAEENLRLREIERKVAVQTILEPERVVPDKLHSSRRIYMRRYYDDILNCQMLCRVVVEEKLDEKIVITAYKTSQIRRYLEER